MNRKQRLSTVTMATLAVAIFPLLGLVTTPAVAASCYPFAATPYSSSTYLVDGTAGQISCTGTAVLQVDLKWDRAFHPDPSLDGRGGTWGNITWQLRGSCVSGAHDYYTEASGSGVTRPSDPRRRITC